MFKTNLKLLAGAALVSVLLAGCGGDSGGSPNVPPPPPPPPPPMQQTITAVADYIRNLFGTTSDSAVPIDVNSITLVPNDQVQPAPVN